MVNLHTEYKLRKRECFRIAGSTSDRDGKATGSFAKRDQLRRAPVAPAWARLCSTEEKCKPPPAHASAC